jgi:MOSC domain-containing protein YiiM
MGKIVIWKDQAKAQLRAIDQPTTLRILHALARYLDNGEATSSVSKTSSLPKFEFITPTSELRVTGRRLVRKLNIDGDEQADLAGHGGEQLAVFLYQMESYHYWEHFLGRSDFMFGQFGENFTVEELADNEVHIGDRYRIGEAIFEVTQPRVTCYRLGIRMNEPRMPSLLVEHRRPGFYFRVLREGEVGAGDEIEQIADGPERMTVADIDGLLYLPGHSQEQLERALRIPALSKGWQSSFQVMLKDESPKAAEGNPGLANEEPAPAWSGFRQMTVASVRKESDGVTSFTMVPVDGEPLPIAQPGQFVALSCKWTEGNHR